jgi:hypothetical protein
MACTIPTKAGKPCKAAPPHPGRDYCLAHAPATERESTGFRADNGSAGRPAKPRTVDLVRERIEAEIDDWLKVLEDAREAVSTIVVGTGPNVRTAVVPDFNARLKAFQVAFDRGYGRPKQTADVQVSNREQVSFIDNPDMVAAHRAMLRTAANVRRN